MIFVIIFSAFFFQFIRYGVNSAQVFLVFLFLFCVCAWVVVFFALIRGSWMCQLLSRD